MLSPSPPGFEAQPRLCSHLSQVEGNLTERKRQRKGFLEQVWGPGPCGKALGVLFILFFYFKF